MAISFFSMVGFQRHSFYLGGLFMDKMVQGSPLGDGSQQTGSNTAIERFWRWKFIEMDVFVVHGDPWGSPGVPGGSQGRPWGSQGRALGSKGRPRVSQGRAIPRIPGGSRDVPGIPGILFTKMIL